VTDITCSDDDSTGNMDTGTAIFRVEAGEKIRCTFTNTRQGTITVKKDTVPAGATQGFVFTGAVTANLKDGQSVSEKLAPGYHTVREVVPADWHLTAIVCDDNDSTGDPGSGVATFLVEHGERVTCTFTNTHDDVVNPPGTIVVAKETMPDGDPAEFTFQGDAAGTISDGQHILISGLKAGTYISKELVPQNWQLTAIQCDDEDSSGDLSTSTATFRLQAGEAVICTFTNERAPALYLPVVLR
jgi:hypothetical protein